MIKNIKTIYYFIIAILGLTAIIVIHELGHFIACKIFHVSTPVFSIGFGPALFSYKIGQTVFKFSLLLLGGYVSINSYSLAQQPYWHQIFILLNGIIFNLLSAFLILAYLYFRQRKACLQNLERLNIKQDKFIKLSCIIPPKSRELFRSQNSGFIGPIGIVKLIGESAKIGFNAYIYLLAIISINIGLFNLLPVPFLDGGQIAELTINKLLGPYFANKSFIYYFMLFIFIIIFIILLNTTNNKNQKS